MRTTSAPPIQATVRCREQRQPPAPPDANLRQTVTIVQRAGTFDVAGIGTGNGRAETRGRDHRLQRLGIAISGAPAAGDTFAVSANTGGVADNHRCS